MKIILSIIHFLIHSRVLRNAQINMSHHKKVLSHYLQGKTAQIDYMLPLFHI